jgi:hypothetical protein
MNFFVRAVITGFAFSLGAAAFKKVSKQLGLDDKPAHAPAAAAGNEGTGSTGSTVVNFAAHTITH